MKISLFVHGATALSALCLYLHPKLTSGNPLCQDPLVVATRGLRLVLLRVVVLHRDLPLVLEGLELLLLRIELLLQLLL